ncbi:hypothetical protein A3C37_03255 [Candidatus Peribacteria bacterium RIFCSPHIGHO2_02_FULL_53_20]|nr:MAG: hypothetical protein A3C37_03255 [Candidatus Peribacteria bacterium RIFCSPHIGHO2_02_FULL_53_20]OGJ67410.1 MAG: hypothetical protein A3B61_00575 [Candidatus Peribacteria bacterium RIFCSPLOWO2_01_FULL_53_10]OGJ72612.1 MAG: hypothetical protein A3G69_01690 [Candidatus Peribacteria bacterium RIFCSPLOWO2_12_FULL_53_10]
MKKLSLLVGALGGSLAGYIFSNQKLREQLTNAKDAEAAAKILGKHLSHDGKKIAKEVQEFVQSDDVQKNLTKARKFAGQKFEEAKKEVAALMETGTERAKVAARKGAVQAKRTVKKMKVKVRAVSR